MSTVNQNILAAPEFASRHSGLFASLRSLPRAAWVLFLGIFLNRFGTFVIPFLTLYMTGRGYSLAKAGVAVGAYGAGTLFACFLGGYLADLIGRRKTITLSMAGGGLTMLLLAHADSWAGIVTLTFVNGLFGELYRPASSALLADLVPAGQRVIAFSAYRMALNAGWAFGPATAGFLANRSFEWLFVGDAISSFLFGVVAWSALPHGVRASSQESGWRVALKDIRSNGPFLQFLVASCFIAWLFYQLSSTYSLFVAQLGYSPATYGALISFNGFVVVCFELIVSNITRRYDPRLAMAVGYVLVGLGFGLNIVATNVWTLGLGIVVFTFGEMISIPVGAAYIADLAPPNMRGRYMGTHGLAWGVTLVFGPGLGMFLFSHGAVLLWSICALSGLAGAAVITINPQTRDESPIQQTAR